MSEQGNVATQDRDLAQAILEHDRPTSEKCRQTYLNNVFWICFWVGAVVPIAAFSSAATAMVQLRAQGLAILLTIWCCVALVAIVSVICATVMMISSRQRPGKDSAD